MYRIALGIAYHGQRYFGWQRQTHPDKPTVQACVESALECVMGGGAEVQVVCAGRTDKGVHATGQVVHFDTSVQRPLRAWVYGTNRYLPNDIAVQWSCAVSNDFHARLSAIERHYRYTIYNHAVPLPLWRNLTTWFPQALDIESMNRAAKLLWGEHDFSSFRASACQSKTAWRCVSDLKVVRDSQNPLLIHIDVFANAFLHHMVRNIVGVLVTIGQGKKPVAWASELLALRDRRAAAFTAPPQGLYLQCVRYPEPWRLVGKESAGWL